MRKIHYVASLGPGFFWVHVKTSHLEAIYDQVEVLAPGSPKLCIVLQQNEKVFCQLFCFCAYRWQGEPQDPDQALQSTCDHLKNKNQKKPINWWSDQTQ